MTRLILLAALVGCGGVEVSTTPDQGTAETTVVAPVTPAVTEATDVTVTPGTTETTVTDPVVPATTPTTTPATGTTPAAETTTTTETTGSLEPQEFQSQTLTVGVDCFTDIQVVECQSTDTTITATQAVDVPVEVAVEAPPTDTQPVETATTEVSEVAADSEASAEESQDADGEALLTSNEVGFLVFAVTGLGATALFLNRKQRV